LKNLVSIWKEGGELSWENFIDNEMVGNCWRS